MYTYSRLTCVHMRGMIHALFVNPMFYYITLDSPIDITIFINEYLFFNIYFDIEVERHLLWLIDESVHAINLLIITFAYKKILKFNDVYK